MSIKQFFVLTKLFLSKPGHLFPTHKATLQAIQICDKKFGRKHHKHGPENAFRHALWNVLIAKNCYKPGRNPEDLVLWAEKVTTLHEKLAPNNPLETAMDLHNNEIGRKIFIEEKLYEKSVEEINVVLLERMGRSVKISNTGETSNFPEALVYIEEV